MSLVADRDADGREFYFEDVSTGINASGFGEVGDGRSFSFHIEHQMLMVEVYRPRRVDPVPQVEDIVATASRGLKGIDLTDERSLTAAVVDAIACATPVTR